MTKRLITLGMAAIVCVAITATVVRSQEKPAPAQDTADAAAAAQREQEMMKNAQPGEAHKRLARLAGEWTYTSTMNVPGQEPQRSEGTAKMMMTLDGRFLHEQNTGQMMGMPVTGTRVTGYNNGAKRYEAVWTWTMSTGMLNLSGTSPDDGKTIHLAGDYDEADGPHRMTVTMKIESDDHLVFELGSPEAPGGAVMVLDYRRKK